MAPTDIVAGCDTASNRFHLWCNDGYGAAVHTEGTPDERRAYLFDFAVKAFGKLPDGSWLVIEEPLALQNGKTTRLLGLAAGAIWAATLQYDLYVVWADVAQWKKAVVGNGAANKDQIRLWVQREVGISFEERDADYYDCVCLCRWGEMQLAKQSKHR